MMPTLSPFFEFAVDVAPFAAVLAYIWIVVGIVILFSPTSDATWPPNLGRFIGNVDTRWLHEPGEDRRMKLLAPFKFVDPRDLLWEAPAGWVVDGASIPRLFWRLADPFIGDYRLASVVHDYYCDAQTRPSWMVHRMFREAMLCAGVAPWRAWIMWAAVRKFGPQFKGSDAAAS